MSRMQKRRLVAATVMVVVVPLFPPVGQLFQHITEIIGISTADAQQISNIQLTPDIAICRTRIAKDSRIDPIRKYLPQYFSAPTHKQTEEPHIPTAKEKEAVAAYNEQRHYCESLIGADIDMHTSRRRAANYSEYTKVSQELRVDLLNGSVSFGQFVTQDYNNLKTLTENDKTTQASEQQGDVGSNIGVYMQTYRQKKIEQQQQLEQRQLEQRQLEQEEQSRASEQKSMACQAAIAKMRTNCGASRDAFSAMYCGLSQGEVNKYCY